MRKREFSAAIRREKMLFGIAFRNVKRQLGGYFIYFVTVALTVSVLFSLNSFIFSEVVETITREAWIEVKVTSGFLSVVLGCVVSAVLGYGCAFLMRRRKKNSDCILLSECRVRIFRNSLRRNCSLLL